jgi:hypothetical protein
MSDHGPPPSPADPPAPASESSLEFDATVAIVLRNAPRFSSTPVSSTRAGASDAGGGTSSIVVIDPGTQSIFDEITLDVTAA